MTRTTLLTTQFHEPCRCPHPKDWLCTRDMVVRFFHVEEATSHCSQCVPKKGTIVQVYKYTYRPSLSSDDLRLFGINPRSIATFVHNGTRVACIHPMDRMPSMTLPGSCATCRQPILEAHTFCSVQCAIMRHRDYTDDNTDMMFITPTTPPRRHTRKGWPTRSPVG